MSWIWFSESPVGIFCLVILLISIPYGLFVLLQQDFFQSSKNDDSKLLLKQLLENFGLEVPPELNESDSSVFKSDKTG